MKYKITYFYNLRFLKPNQIPVSTAIWDPKWIREKTHNNRRPYVDENGVIIGIKEESFLLNEEEIPEEMCSGQPCPYKDKWPHCQFLDAYWKHLQKIDFDGYLIPELNRVAEDVRKITHYEGEPEIILLVHEKPDNPCSERLGLQKLFQEHGIILEEWSKDDSGEIF